MFFDSVVVGTGVSQSEDLGLNLHWIPFCADVLASPLPFYVSDFISSFGLNVSVNGLATSLGCSSFSCPPQGSWSPPHARLNWRKAPEKKWVDVKSDKVWLTAQVKTRTPRENLLLLQFHMLGSSKSQIQDYCWFLRCTASNFPARFSLTHIVSQADPSHDSWYSLHGRPGMKASYWAIGLSFPPCVSSTPSSSSI